MITHRLSIAASLLLATLLIPGVVAAQMLNCDNGFVTFSNNVVRVTPNGSDDTMNIQCALDFARDNDIPVVRLSAGEFSISSLELEGFSGTFEGTSRVNTIVTVQENSIACGDMTDAGRSSAAIRFIGGEPRIRFMTLITGEHPCSDGARLTSQVHFTGMGANTACGNDLIFGNVDRMNFQGISNTFKTDIGVSAWAEGHWFGTCRNTLTGTMKVNRSAFQGLSNGVVTSMQAGAQVDVNFNIFETVFRAYEMQRSNQNTTVAFNTFTGTSTSGFDYFGIEVDSQGSGNPAKTSITVKDNTFNIGESGSLSSAYFARTMDSDTILTAVLTGNTFNLEGLAEGIVARDSSNGTISNNRFTGTANVAITLGSFAIVEDPTVTDWSVTGNIFDNIQSDFADIFMGNNSARCIIGPDQTESVFDNGTDNFKLSTSQAQ